RRGRRGAGGGSRRARRFLAPAPGTHLPRAGGGDDDSGRRARTCPRARRLGRANAGRLGAACRSQLPAGGRRLGETADAVMLPRRLVMANAAVFYRVAL